MSWKNNLADSPKISKENYNQCPRTGTPYLIGDDHKNAKRTIIKARCKQWDCPYCAEVNRSVHYNRIVSNIHRRMSKGDTFSFVTITCHEKWRGFDASSTNWFRNKDKLLARYRRAVKKRGFVSPNYVYIPETHTDESIHIHGVFSDTLSGRWWKDNSRSSGLGYQCKSKEVTSVRQAVNYCVKYITKEMGKPSPTKGFRRINYSRSFAPLVRSNSELDWRMVETDESIKDAILEGLLKKNYAVSFDGTNWTTDDFLGG